MLLFIEFFQNCSVITECIPTGVCDIHLEITNTIPLPLDCPISTRFLNFYFISLWLPDQISLFSLDFSMITRFPPDCFISIKFSYDVPISTWFLFDISTYITDYFSLLKLIFVWLPCFHQTVLVPPDYPMSFPPAYRSSTCFLIVAQVLPEFPYDYTVSTRLF